MWEESGLAGTWVQTALQRTAQLAAGVTMIVVAAYASPLLCAVASTGMLGTGAVYLGLGASLL